MRTKEDQTPSLQDQLRAGASARRDVFNPHWDEEARRLMLWAANTLEAANFAIKEYYKRSCDAE